MSEPDQQEEPKQQPQSNQPISPEEAEAKWSNKIYTPVGTKADVNKMKDQLMEDIKQEMIKGKINYYNKMKQKDQAIIRSQEHIYKSDKPGDQIPIDGDFVNGSKVFMRNCAGCHTLESSCLGRKGTGPALGLIFGRRIAADSNYDYSQSMLKSHIIWTQKSLFNFLREPKKMIKGSLCSIPNNGIESEEDRADLIKFLKLFSKNLSKNLRIKANQAYGKEYVDYQMRSQILLDQEGQRRLQEHIREKSQR